MKQLWEVAGFLRGLQAQLRFGDFRKAPLRLLRLQMKEETFECDWVARPMDSWDMTLPGHEREQKASVQAMEDAMKLRDMLFGLIPEVRVAVLRVFRQSAREPPRLIIAGTVTRQLPAIQQGEVDGDTGQVIRIQILDERRSAGSPGVGGPELGFAT